METILKVFIIFFFINFNNINAQENNASSQKKGGIFYEYSEPFPVISGTKRLIFNENAEYQIIELIHTHKNKGVLIEDPESGNLIPDPSTIVWSDSLTNYYIHDLKKGLIYMFDNQMNFIDTTLSANNHYSLIKHFTTSVIIPMIEHTNNVLGDIEQYVYSDTVLRNRTLKYKTVFDQDNQAYISIFFDDGIPASLPGLCKPDPKSVPAFFAGYSFANKENRGLIMNRFLVYEDGLSEEEINLFETFVDQVKKVKEVYSFP